jgi:HlyD family secretion protein
MRSSICGPAAQSWEVIVAKPRTNLLRVALPVVVVLVVVGVVLFLRTRNKPKELTASGTLEARTVNVGSLVGGRVVRILIDEGSHVVAGEILMTLETETIDRQIAQQQAAIEAAQAQLAKAVAGPRPQEISKAQAIATNDEVDRHRFERLYRAGIVAKEQLDDAATKAKASAEDLRVLQLGTRKEDIEAARAQMEEQRRQLDSLMKQRAETTIRTSVTGVVQSMGLRPGDLVAPNQPVAEILEASQLWVRVYVPETELGLIRVNQQVKVHVDTFPNETFAGTIGTISSQGEYTPRNVQTKAQRAEQVFGVKVLMNPDPKLKAGMAADVDFGVKGRAE